MTPGECRAARALLNWSQFELATASGADASTIRAFETEEMTVAESNVSALQGALEAAGIEFISEIGGGTGVRLRPRR
ncbi:helix-turn-helix domain-containing protein [Aureimonas populi]|uniref:Multiprotein-bridging factor 1 family protein n=1 Tax=Aureimonas populi TaxID=1701758 RepID=A0ABW5CK98_9HYPH|nr:transcriptional regulator [Aureimonas populi]